LNGRLSNHPNVVTVLDSGFVDGRYPYLAMELFEHGSLTDQLRQRGPFEVAAALHIGVRIAGALESAHGLGVLHRDVKPQNILQSRFGEPALADFGIATILELEQSFTAALTPVHAAPEVLEGADPTPRTDVYALGSTIFTILAGSPPFAAPPGEGMLAQLLRITTSDLPAMARADVPPTLIDVLRRAMAKRPDERLASAAALGEALQRVQVDLGVPVTLLPVEAANGIAANGTRMHIVGPGAAVASSTPTTTTTSVGAGNGKREHPDVALPPPQPDAPAAARASTTRTRTMPAPEATTLVTAPSLSVAAIDASAHIEEDQAASTDEHTVGLATSSPTIIGRQVHPAQPTAPPKRRRWVAPVAIAGSVVVGVAGALGIATLLDHGRGKPSTAPTSSSPTTTIVSTTVPADLKALAPTGLGASLQTNAVLLTWTDNTKGQSPQLIYTYPASLGIKPITVKAGATSQIVALDPTSPACFRVVAFVAFGSDQSAPALTANSEPSCINGAVPKTASP
jgi:serine/threonine-protein kinase PknK